MSLLFRRLLNQHIYCKSFATEVDVVAHMGAIQAQDYAGCKWAVGLRMAGATDATVERAINAGEIIRTHVLRPTWHLVAPADVRWMLELTAPRVNAANAYQYRRFELNDRVFNQCNKIIVKALELEKQLTRAAIAEKLAQKGIDTSDVRLTCIMMYAELAGLICNGARQGKQFTYALLDERVPATRPLKRDEALAELAGRYFNSHGPATLQDFVWWSGLTVSEARQGLESIKAGLRHDQLDGDSYWFSENNACHQSPGVGLLPAFDEYMVAYKDRRILLGKDHTHVSPLSMLNPGIIVNGQLAGSWKRTLSAKAVEVELRPYTKLAKPVLLAINRVAQQYAAFLALPLKQKIAD